MMTTLLCQTKFLSLVETDGWAYATRNPNNIPNRKPNAVYICAVVDEKLLLISEYRKPLQCREWATPAGLIDAGETVREAATRELFEETGLKVTRFDEDSPVMSSSAGCTDELGQVVYCFAEGTISKDYLEAGEDIEARLFTISEVQSLLKSGEMISTKAYLACVSFMFRHCAKRFME
jgi:ADP-ribose pyrophosphatase